MTIQSFSSRVSHNTDGTSTSFPVSFAFFDSGDIKVWLIDAHQDEVLLDVGSDYTVTGGNGGEGSVILSSPPASGGRLVIQRDLPLTQLVDYITGGAFPAETHERALDRLTLISQQLADGLSRSVKLPATTENAADLSLPEAAPGKALVWNSAGDGLFNSAFDLDIYAAETEASRDSAADSAGAALVDAQAAAQSKTAAAASADAAAIAEAAAIAASPPFDGDSLTPDFTIQRGQLFTAPLETVASASVVTMPGKEVGSILVLGENVTLAPPAALADHFTLSTIYIDNSGGHSIAIGGGWGNDFSAGLGGSMVRLQIETVGNAVYGYASEVVA